MKSQRRTFQVLSTAAAVGSLFLAALAQAHVQWIEPNVFMPAAESGESVWISFDHTFGDTRFQPDGGPTSYYSWWIVGPDGLRRNVPHLFQGKTRTVGEIELEDVGTYRLEAVEDQLPWTLISIDDEDTWQPGIPADFDGREIVRSRVYFSKSVSYVSLNSVSKAAVAATGDPLEIVFMSHPNALTAGESFRVRVLASGEPLAEQEVRVFAEGSQGHDANETCTTNDKGVCHFDLADPGRYLIVASRQGDNPEGSATEGFSHGYSVLVGVAAAAE